MQLRIFAAFAALASAPSLTAQPAVAPASVDARYLPVLPGNWVYAPAPDGSEASFLDSSGRPQLFVRCIRATRRVTVSKPGTGAVPFLFFWTSSMSRNVPASFDPATARISVAFGAYDSLLDQIAFSRAKFAVGVAGTTPLVLPAWPEAARPIEDCRA